MHVSLYVVTHTCTQQRFFEKFSPKFASVALQKLSKGKGINMADAAAAPKQEKKKKEKKVKVKKPAGLTKVSGSLGK